MSAAFKELEAELSKKGVKIPKEQFYKVKKILESKERNENKSSYPDNPRKYGIGYHTEFTDFNCKGIHPESDDDEIYVPITLYVGITISLCGLFLLRIPMPYCKTKGAEILGAGLGIIGGYALEKAQEKEDQEKAQKKKIKKKKRKNNIKSELRVIFNKRH